MEYIQKFFKKSGWISILESIIFALLGLVLIYNADTTVKIISSMLGIIFIIVGTCKIINWISSGGRYSLYNLDLFYGLIAIAIGVVAIMYSGAIETVFRVIVGVWIIYMSIIRMSLALKIKKLDSKIWIWTLVLAVLMFVCGIYIISNSGALIMTIGAIMVAYSIIDIIENIIFMKNIKEIF